MTTLPDVEAQLAALATSLDREDATLAALLPCEPAVGEVAVAFWTHADESVSYELLRLADGGLLEDPVALRECFTLLAMTETLEELASFEQSRQLADTLDAWIRENAPDDATLVQAAATSTAALRALAELAPSDSARIARTQLLDEIGGALRTLENTWMALEQAAVAWSDSQLDASGTPIGDARERVPALWRVLGEARRGPLQSPASTALQHGREAGLALAAAATGGTAAT
ncbi:MAG: hypothetical protein JWM25_42 [Thermoleophilia bacterium]|nr:hypothetical protein [Thermoleophilia bacterium]MCZ4495459.1 hypothetical protein [Thermoleophilia bacterium]